jgi:bifunctional enzyme CysN/CysC
MTGCDDVSSTAVGAEAMSGTPVVEPEPGLGLLRFLTCGSVDDGKSTLIGRLLFDTGSVFDDQLVALGRDSDRHGTAGADTDYALLVDGLQAEREQGITIDVAWRSFATPRRRFIIADTPGHEQYTRNMATGASTCELAIVLVDARNGIRPQTLRHAQIAALMGIRHVVLAINKMDLVGHAEARFRALADAFADATKRHRFVSVVPIPIVARGGDNVVGRSAAMPWYLGPTLLAHLEGVDVSPIGGAQPFRMPVQLVSRANSEFRGYAGTVASGVVRRGERVGVAGGATEAVVARIVTFDGDRDEAGEGCAVTLALDREVDVSRGDVLVDPRAPLGVTDQFACNLVWLADTPLIAGRPYLVKIGARTVGGTVTRIRHRLEIGTGTELTAETLSANDVGLVQLATSAPIAFAPYGENRTLGGFILIDRQTNSTVAVGMIVEAVQQAANLTWHAPTVDRLARARQKGQMPAVVWFTGLSGSGKSTIANLVERQLHALGRHSFVLDGDNVRHGLNRDLGFSETDRVENIRRAAEVARLMADAGLIVLVSFISPYRTDREMARERIGDVAFLEAHVDTSLEECARRDVKGLYARALAGEIKNFTGVSAPYEPPSAPELRLPTAEASADGLAAQVVDALRRHGCLGDA